MTGYTLSKLMTVMTALFLTACAHQGTSNEKTTDIINSEKANLLSLNNALAIQDDKAKARYQHRHPKETLEFFEIEPGMTVVEVLPGGGWYTKILLPYLGENGKIIGADYPINLWSNFSFMTPEKIEEKKTWVTDWVQDASEWKTQKSANLDAFQFNAMPETMQGTADAVLFIRAMHNLNRFEPEGGYLTSALNESFAALKPGGLLGIVQHQGSEGQPDKWANGDNGYLKQSYVIEQVTAAGFEFVAQSNINNNPKDQAVEGEAVWRLLPSLRGADDDPVKKAAAEAIGESNRMTLKFRKPI